MNYFIKKFFLFVLPALMSYPVIAQQKKLTEDQFFKGNFKTITQSLPTVTRWIDDSHFLLMKEGKAYVVDAKTGIESPSTDADNKTRAVPVKPSTYSKNSDLYIKINDSDVQLTMDKDKELNPTMSPDGNYVAYTKNNDLYTVDINSKKENRLTMDGSDVILNGYSSWVYMEEILGRSTQHKAFWWSPDSKHLAYFRFDDTNVPIFTITDGTGQHGLVEKERYPKVGDPNPEVKVGIVAPGGGVTVWAAFNSKDDQYFGMPYWKPDGKLLVQWMNRLQDSLLIYQVDISTGAKTPFYTENQKTWVDLDDNDRLSFFKNGKGFILFNDVSGWRHMYYYDNTGKMVNPVTSGKFTVTDLNYIDEKKGIVYFTARGIENSARKDFYKVGLDGKNLKRLTFGEFNHSQVNLSPDASYFITTHNNVTTPTKLTLVNNNGKVIRELGDSKGAEFNNYQLAKTEIVRVKSDDGLYDLPMKVTWPVNVDKNKKYPVLISIYGGPNAGSVMDTWLVSGSQQWYANEGLIQVSMDHRGSGHFGKEGINYMYHNLGHWEIKDYSSLVKWLITNGNADSAKICITGFSYGGYMSTYALTYGADVFTHGMAGGSVVDWTLYDSHYTERFMGTMANNAEGYKKSSALTYTDKYKGMLQIVHGVIDDNVHLQNSIQLISKLQDDKKDFEFMIYSGGRHGWGGNKNLHFQNLKTKFIYKYLLEKEVPKGLLK